MTSVDAMSSAAPGSAAGILALLERDAAVREVAGPHPIASRWDVLAAPLDNCCGIFAEFAGNTGPVPPIARLGDLLLFLVRKGSVAEVFRCSSRLAACAALEIQWIEAAEVPRLTAGSDDPSWVVPLGDDQVELPAAAAVVTAIQAAYVATSHREGQQ
jgi:hypothetical protein